METVAASEVRQVETQSTIGFTGTYVPIGTQDPIPPVTEIARPDVLLPQTNTVTSHWLLEWGILILSLGFWF